VTLQRDQGEGRYVQVRGTDPRLSSAAINGETLPAPEGDIRYVALDVVPADLLEAIEVTKALTPDMDGDSIGGAVNLITRQAAATRFSWTAGVGYNDIVSDGLQTANAAYASRFADGRGGIALAGSFLNTNRGSENFEAEYDDGDLDSFETRAYQVNRKRYGVNGALDYAFSESSNFFVKGILNKFDDQEYRRATISAVGDGEIQRELKDRYEEQVIGSLSAGGNRRFENLMRLDYRVSFSYAEENEPDALYSVFLQEDVEFDPNVSADFIDPDNIQPNPRNEDPSESLLNEQSLERNKTTDRDVVAALDLSRPFDTETLGGLWKAGLKLRFKDKDRGNNTTLFEPEGDVFLTQFADPDPVGSSFLDGRYQVGPHVNPDAARGFVSSLGLEAEEDVEAQLANYEAQETTTAGYGMFDLNLGAKTRLLAGARYEFVDVSYVARDLVFDEGGDLASVAPVEGTSDYGQFLPMVHLKYELDSDTNLRAAFTRSYARANYSDLVPFRLVIEEDREIETGNPDLKPTTSWNLDVLGERYFSSVGVLSGGFFYKDLTDMIFIATREEDVGGDEYDVTQAQNLPNAEVLGFEAAYQNSLRFLPSPLDGLGLYANVTFTSSDAVLPGRESEDNRLPGQAGTVGNLAIAYEKYGFSGRIAFNYHDAYLYEVADDAASDVYIDEHFQIDFSASQRLGGGFRLFAEIVNLNDEPWRLYEGTPDRPIQEEYYSWWGTFGIKWDF
jgi:TonB-dependent receptor